MGLDSLSARHQIAGERQVIVTEVTRMSGGLVCVAALDVHSGTMVRPLQGDGSNWEEAKWVDTGYMVPGNVLSLVPADPGHPAYPHASEDFRVATVRSLEQGAFVDLYQVCTETADASVEAIFDGALMEGKYVVAGTECRSLGCLMLPRNKLRVSEYYGKVQVSYQDSSHTWHNFRVTDLAIKNAGDAAAGVAALSEKIAASSYFRPLALRLGLARAWDGGDKGYDPKRCFLQLNGLVTSSN